MIASEVALATEIDIEISTSIGSTAGHTGNGPDFGFQQVFLREIQRGAHHRKPLSMPLPWLTKTSLCKQVWRLPFRTAISTMEARRGTRHKPRDI